MLQCNYVIVGDFENFWQKSFSEMVTAVLISILFLVTHSQFLKLILISEITSNIMFLPYGIH